MDETPRTSGFLAWWHRTPLYLRIIGGMVLGVVVGLLLGKGPLNLFFFTIREPAADLAIPSKLVLRLLGALAPAIILLAIVRALIAARFQGRLLRLLILNTLVAICVGLVVANVVRPGQHTQLSMPAGFRPPVDRNVLTEFLENVPKSLLGPLSDDGKVIGVIFIAVAFGVALRRSRHPALPTAVSFLELAFEAVVVILHWIIDLVPIAVFGLVASIVGTKGFGAFHALGVFVLAVLGALLIQAIYYLVRIRFGSWVRPFALIRGTSDALVMAFSTGSSTITMPVTYERLRHRVGLREKSASMGALVGSNFNNDGTALYEAMAALFIAQGLGLHLTIGQQLLVVLTSIVASVGAAGIPEAGLVTMVLVFNAVGLPPEYIGLLLPVDWFLDRARTAINVMGDMNVACLLDGHSAEKSGTTSADPTPPPHPEPTA